MEQWSRPAMPNRRDRVIFAPILYRPNRGGAYIPPSPMRVMISISVVEPIVNSV